MHSGIINDWIDKRNNYIREFTFSVFIILDQYSEIERKHLKKNRETSSDFNIFNFFKIKETIHSVLVGNLLNPIAEHGQGNLFLIQFLNQLGIDDPHEGRWNVTIESGRVDILIKRNHPHSVIIIENKSNDANDQPGQLYRYWYNEIYLPNKSTNPKAELQLYPENKYKIVYLVSDDNKEPEMHSLQRPQENKYLGLPEKLIIPPIIWTFKIEIGTWLKSCLLLDGLKKDNIRIREYLQQYLEYWN